MKNQRRSIGRGELLNFANENQVIATDGQPAFVLHAPHYSRKFCAIDQNHVANLFEYQTVLIFGHAAQDAPLVAVNARRIQHRLELRGPAFNGVARYLDPD